MKAENLTTIPAGLQFFNPVRRNKSRIPAEQLQAETVRLAV